MRNFGLKVGVVGTVKFEARIKALVENLPDLAVERLFCRGILANELNSPLLHFRIEFHVVVMVWRAAKLTYRATLRAFKGENEAGRDANLHLCVGVFA